jgi:hypothetical protein
LRRTAERDRARGSRIAPCIVLSAAVLACWVCVRAADCSIEYIKNVQLSAQANQEMLKRLHAKASEFSAQAGVCVYVRTVPCGRPCV